MDKSQFSQRFLDMRRRVLNKSDCPTYFMLNVLSVTWSSGLMFHLHDDERIMASMGDLTISVTIKEMFILADIAANPNSKYAGQW